MTDRQKKDKITPEILSSMVDVVFFKWEAEEQERLKKGLSPRYKNLQNVARVSGKLFELEKVSDDWLKNLAKRKKELVPVLDETRKRLHDLYGDRKKAINIFKI